MVPQGVPGFLIVLEGIDGSGKSTLARNLARALKERGRDVVSTREPTDGPTGRRIRAIARGTRQAVSPEQELALFQEDRRAHVSTVVRPALARGAVVVQDRSYFSTVAYQGERGLDRRRILADSEAIAPKPDLLLVIDLPVDEALKRIAAGRAAGPDDFESAEALARIRAVFLAFDDAVVLDGCLSPGAVTDAALEAIGQRLPSPGGQ